MTVARFGVARRRARLVRRHRLLPTEHAASVEQVAADLVALHGTDPATVFLSAAARLHHPQVATRVTPHRPRHR